MCCLYMGIYSVNASKEIPLEFLDVKMSYFLSHFSRYLGVWVGFPGSSDSKESACHAGDLGLIPGLGRSPGEGNGNPL